MKKVIKSLGGPLLFMGNRLLLCMQIYNTVEGDYEGERALRKSKQVNLIVVFKIRNESAT